jgi:amino acid transporter
MFISIRKKILRANKIFLVLALVSLAVIVIFSVWIISFLVQNINLVLKQPVSAEKEVHYNIGEARKILSQLKFEFDEPQSEK